MQLLKKPDRSDDNESEIPKEKAKKPEKPTKEDRSVGSGDHKRRQNIDHKEDRGRKSVTHRFVYVCFLCSSCFFRMLKPFGYFNMNRKRQ